MSNPTLFLYTGNGSLAFQDRAGGGTLTGSGAVRYLPAPGARINHAANPCLATNGIGWEQSGGALVSRVADSDFRSGYAAEVFANAPTKGLKYGVTGGASATPAMRAFAIAGNTLTIGFDAELVSGDDEWEILVQTINASGGGASSAPTTPDFTPTATVSRFVVSVTLPSNAGAHGVLVYWRPVGSAVGTIRVSDLTLVLGSDDGSYFDGSTGGVWLDPITGILGTAHASPSVSQAVAWVEEGTTNLCLNPSMETNITNWVNAGTSTFERVSTYAYIGSYAGHAIFDGSTTYPNVSAGTTTGFSTGATPQTGTISVLLRGSGTVYLVARWYEDTYSATTDVVSSAITLTDAWVRYTVSATSSPSSSNDSFNLIIAGNWSGGTSTANVYWDAAQIEIKAYATSYADGSLGTGYAWSGTAHASSSTRTQCQLSTTVTADNRINTERGSFAARAELDYIVSANQYLMKHGDYGASDDFLGAIKTTGLKARMWGRGSATDGAADSSASLSAGTWFYHYGDWNGTEVRLSLDQATLVTATRGTPSGTPRTDSGLYIGSYSGTFHLNGYIGPILIADRPLTAKERATLNARTSWGWSTLKGGKPGLLLPI